MTATETLILEKLDQIERRLNQILVPIQREEQRQIDGRSAAQRKAHAHARWKAKSA